MNLCTHCGHEVPLRAKFCVRCGTPVTTRDPEETALRSELADVLPAREAAESTEIDATGTDAGTGTNAPASTEVTAETLPREEVQAIVAGLPDSIDDNGADDNGVDDNGADDTSADDSETREHPRLDPHAAPHEPPQTEPHEAPTPEPHEPRTPARALDQATSSPATAGIGAGEEIRLSPTLPARLEFEPWLTDEIDELPDEPASEPLPRRSTPLSRWRELRGKTRAGILGGIAAVVVFVVMVTFIVVVQGAARGGANSPQDAVDQFSDAIVTGDVGAALGMVAPDERDALDRIRSAAAAVFGSLALGDAVRTVDGRGGNAGLELSLAGVAVTVSNLEPVVSQLSSELAVARLTHGTITLDIDPGATEGLLRTAFATQGQPESRIQETYDLASYGNAAPTLILRKASGLWYVSPLFTALEYTVGANGVLEASGTSAQLDAEPASSTTAASPTAAAEAFADALGPATSGDLRALAAAVQPGESPLVALYGAGLVATSGLPRLSIDSVSLSEGEHEGGRVQVILDSLTGTIDGIPMEATSTCVSRGSEETCLNGSGYIPPATNGLLTLAADRGAFSVTTVQDPNGWYVSLIDTAADHLISSLRSLTKEQALATLGLERASPTDAALIPGATTTIAFNSAGYATRTLRLTHSARVRWADSTVTATAYDAKGESHFIGGWSSTDLTGGNYTLVLHAGRDWARKFAAKGDTVNYRADVRLLRL